MNTEHTTMTTVYILLNEHRTYNNDDCIYCQMNAEHKTMMTVYILLNEHRTYNNGDCIYC